MSIRFATDFPDELRLQIQTSEVVSKKVALKQKGKEHSGLCPFHNEKTPSFTVNDQKGFYHCFGCGAHGDIISFIMNTQGLEFKETVLKLASDYNIPVPIIKPENQKQDDFRQQKVTRQFQLLEEINKFFESNLSNYVGQDALSYLHTRGLSNKDIKKFRIGYAQDSYNSLHLHLTKSGFSESELLESGAVGKNQNTKLYDKFRNRVMFPISSKNGKIIAFGGRILGEGQPKYLNSSETLLFKKGSNLYNYSTARKSIFEKKFAILVEGYMDVIGLDINGIENSVAPLGTAVTKDQLLELFKITNDVVVFLDGDKAGIQAMSRVIDLALPLITSEKMLRFAILPSNLDPDDFIKQNGKLACEELLNQAQTLSQTLFDFEAKNLGIIDFNSHIAPEKKANLESKLMQKVELVNDTNNKKYFSQYYKNRLFEIGRNKKPLFRAINKPQTDFTPNVNHEDLYGQSILSILIHEPKLIDYQDDHCNIRELDFEDETLSNIKESLIDFFDTKSTDEKNDYNSQELLETLNNLSIDRKTLDKILRKKQSSNDTQIKLRILALKHHHIQVSKQYQDILAKVDDLKTCNSSLGAGKHKELFDHKTQLEKEILELESNLT
jgi:DNA primase